MMHGKEVKLLAYSVGTNAPPIASFKLRYPRMVHADFMTHRVFTRNASSSRATPVMKLALATTTDLYTPQFRENKPGMQPGWFLSKDKQEVAEKVWEEAARACLKAAAILADPEGLNVHKQWANRMLEWFGYINVVVTSTEWKNFFDLRLALDADGMPMAQDEIYEIAREMKILLEHTVPDTLEVGEWHLPYVLPEERGKYSLEELKAISVARNASTSYQTVDGKLMDAERAIALFMKLKDSKHWSPFEHQASPDEWMPGNVGPYGEWRVDRWGSPHLHGNFNGWIQHRKTFPGESGGH